MDGRSRDRLTSASSGIFVALVLMLGVVGCGSASTPRSTTTPTPTSSPVSRTTVSYVALGASDAVGIGATNPLTQAYVPILISRLPRGSRVLNLGISGIELGSALQRELPEAIAARPTLMTIWLVANDFKDCASLSQYRTDLETLLAQLQAQTHAAIFMANLPDMSQLPAIRQQSVGLGACLIGASTQQIRAMVAQWNAVIAQAAQRHGVVLVDLTPFDIAAHPEYIAGDGFHPSSAGYLQLANLFWADITVRKAVPTP